MGWCQEGGAREAGGCWDTDGSGIWDLGSMLLLAWVEVDARLLEGKKE